MHTTTGSPSRQHTLVRRTEKTAPCPMSAFPPPSDGNVPRRGDDGGWRGRAAAHPLRLQAGVMAARPVHWDSWLGPRIPLATTVMSPQHGPDAPSIMQTCCRQHRGCLSRSTMAEGTSSLQLLSLVSVLNLGPGDMTRVWLQLFVCWAGRALRADLMRPLCLLARVHQWHARRVALLRSLTRC